MNKELKKLAIDAGAPEEMLNQLWFNIFCIKFADLIIQECEQLDD